MPIGLRRADVADSAVAGRVAFVVDPTGQGTATVLAAVRSMPGVVVPDGPSDLFERGLNPVIGNYLTAVHLRGGVSALADERTFLLALRDLADSVYASVLDRTGADLVVEASPSSLATAQVIQALYPDAPLIVVDDRPADDPALSVLRDPFCHIDSAALSNGPAPLRRQLAEVITAARAASIDPDGPAGSEPAPLHDDEGWSGHGGVVLIVGCPRSGTTWLEHLLSVHPTIDGPGRETAIFEAFGSLWDNVSRASSEGLAGWIDRRDLVTALRRCCDALFGACLVERGRMPPIWFLEKTPGHGWRLDLIAEVYPDAWVLSIHRDGRDVARSLMEVSFGPDDLAVAAIAWRDLTGLIERTGPACPRFRDIAYEDLLHDPVTISIDLLEWMGLPVDAEIVSGLEARAGERVSRYNTSGEVGAGKWSSMSRADLSTIYRHAGDRLVALGYLTPAELSAIRSSPSYRAGRLIERLRRVTRRRSSP